MTPRPSRSRDRRIDARGVITAPARRFPGYPYKDDMDKSETVAASDLRPCDKCGGRMVPTFFRVRIEHAVLHRDAVNALVGTAQTLGGGSKAWDIARVMSPCDPIATVATSKTLLLCVECFSAGDSLATAWQVLQANTYKPR